MASAIEKRFKETALAGGYCSPGDLERAEIARESDPKGRNLVTMLVAMKILSREQVEAVKRQMDSGSVPVADPPPEDAPAPGPALDGLPESPSETETVDEKELPPLGEPLSDL
ncbi:MAG: hypothetical protein ACYTHM_25365, partial [Planctomycetota bacterium]